MNGKPKKILSIVLSVLLLWQQSSYAQMLALDMSKFMSTPSAFATFDKFRPAHLRYFSYNTANNDLKVLLDKGDSTDLSGLKLKNSTQELLKYFLIGVTLPDELFWVNLRPDAETSIIDPVLARTNIGKIFLESDLQLKKDTALATSPQTREGKEYWDKLYKKAGEIFGTDNITIPTLTRPWIVPGEVILREGQGNVYIYKATLKVCLEQDHLKNSSEYQFNDPRMKALNEYSSQLIRELIIPKLTKTINTSKSYSQLRQVYYSLILARWFKARFSNKQGAYPALINRQDLTNLTSTENWSKTTYFNAYQKSFKNGEYNIQTPTYTVTGQTIRNYFSGGIGMNTPIVGTGAASPASGLFGRNAGFDGALTSSPRTALLGASVTGNGVPNLVMSSPIEKLNAHQIATVLRKAGLENAGSLGKEQVYIVVTAPNGWWVDRNSGKLIIEGEQYLSFQNRFDFRIPTNFVTGPNESLVFFKSKDNFILCIKVDSSLSSQELLDFIASCGRIILNGEKVEVLKSNLLQVLGIPSAAQPGSSSSQTTAEEINAQISVLNKELAQLNVRKSTNVVGNPRYRANEESISNEISSVQRQLGELEHKLRRVTQQATASSSSSVANDRAMSLRGLRLAIQDDLEVYHEIVRSIPSGDDVGKFRQRETAEFNRDWAWSNIRKRQAVYDARIRKGEREEALSSSPVSLPTTISGIRAEIHQLELEKSDIQARGALLQSAGPGDYADTPASLAADGTRVLTRLSALEQQLKTVIDDEIPVNFHEQDFTTGHVATPKSKVSEVFSPDQTKAILTWLDDSLLNEHGGLGRIAVRLKIIPEDALNTEGSSKNRVSSVSIVLIAADATEGPEIYKGKIRIDPLDVDALVRGEKSKVEFFPLKDINPKELASTKVTSGQPASSPVEMVAPLSVSALRDSGNIERALNWVKGNRYIFGGGFGYDIRINDAVSELGDVAVFHYALGRTFGGKNYLDGRGKALITGDQRSTSPAFRKALIQGLADEGIDVVTQPDDNVITTALTSRKGLAEGFDLVIQISGSHNPPKGNGAKIVFKGLPFFGNDLIKLNEAVEAQDGWSRQLHHGRVTVVNDIIEEHVQALDKATPALHNPPNAIVDFRLGAASTVFPALAERKGYKIVTLDSADANLPSSIFATSGQPVMIVLNRDPSPGMEAGIWDPSKPEAYDQIKKLQLRIYNDSRFKGKKFSGIVFDGDGDRSGFIDEGSFEEQTRTWNAGVVVAPDRMLMSFYQRFVLANIDGIRALNKLGHTVKLALDVRASAVIVQVLQDIARNQKVNIEGEFIAAGYPNHRGFVRKEVTVITDVLAAHQGSLTAEELQAVQKLIREYPSAEASGHFFFNVLSQEQFSELKTVVDDGITSSIIYLHLVDTLGNFEKKGQSYSEPSVKQADGLFATYTVTNEVRLEKAPADVRKKQALAERIIMKFAQDNPRLIQLPVNELAERVAQARDVPPERQSARESLLLVDGVRLVLSNGLWVLFRKSNTSAVITFKAEADTVGKEAQMYDLLQRLIKAITAVKGEDPAFTTLETAKFEAEVQRFASVSSPVPNSSSITDDEQDPYDSLGPDLSGLDRHPGKSGIDDLGTADEDFNASSPVVVVENHPVFLVSDRIPDSITLSPLEADPNKAVLISISQDGRRYEPVGEVRMNVVNNTEETTVSYLPYVYPVVGVAEGKRIYGKGQSISIGRHVILSDSKVFSLEASKDRLGIRIEDRSYRLKVELVDAGEIVPNREAMRSSLSDKTLWPDVIFLAFQNRLYRNPTREEYRAALMALNSFTDFSRSAFDLITQYIDMQEGIGLTRADHQYYDVDRYPNSGGSDDQVTSGDLAKSVGRELFEVTGTEPNGSLVKEGINYIKAVGDARWPYTQRIKSARDFAFKARGRELAYIEHPEQVLEGEAKIIVFFAKKYPGKNIDMIEAFVHYWLDDFHRNPTVAEFERSWEIAEAFNAENPELDHRYQGFENARQTLRNEAVENYGEIGRTLFNKSPDMLIEAIEFYWINGTYPSINQLNDADRYIGAELKRFHAFRQNGDETVRLIKERELLISAARAFAFKEKGKRAFEDGLMKFSEAASSPVTPQSQEEIRARISDFQRTTEQFSMIMKPIYPETEKPYRLDGQWFPRGIGNGVKDKYFISWRVGSGPSSRYFSEVVFVGTKEEVDQYQASQEKAPGVVSLPEAIQTEEEIRFKVVDLYEHHLAPSFVYQEDGELIRYDAEKITSYNLKEGYFYAFFNGQAHPHLFRFSQVKLIASREEYGKDRSSYIRNLDLIARFIVESHSDGNAYVFISAESRMITMHSSEEANNPPVWAHGRDFYQLHFDGKVFSVLGKTCDLLEIMIMEYNNRAASSPVIAPMSETTRALLISDLSGRSDLEPLVLMLKNDPSAETLDIAKLGSGLLQRAHDAISARNTALLKQANAGIDVDAALQNYAAALDNLNQALSLVQSTGSSPAQEKNADVLGGIDFRSIPMLIQPMGGFTNLAFNLPRVNNLEKINLDQELKDIKAMVAGGIIPSGERVKKYIAACYQKRVSRDKLDNLIPELIQICKLQEEDGAEADQDFKQALVLVDAI